MTDFEFGDNNYLDVAQWRLVLYALATLEFEDKETTIDDIAVRSYNIFPKKFSMLAYPEYPDQMRVGRELARAYSFGFIKERKRKTDDKHKRAKSYKLTPEGEAELDDIKARIEAPLDQTKVKDGRSKDEAILKQLEKSMLYQGYQKSKSIQVKEYLFKHMLFLPTDADEKNVRKALEYMKTLCRANGRDDLLTFLTYCEEHRTRF